jgi:hypothetical protein
MHTGSSIQLHPARENSDFSRQRNYYFPKVVILLSCHLSEAFTRRIGWQVGSDPEIQVATVVSNHLTAGIMKYFGDSGRYQQVANLYEKLVVKEPEVSSLLARSYIGMSACLVMTRLNSFFNAAIFSRRGSEGSANHGICYATNPSSLYPSSRSVRLPSFERETRMGRQARSASRQLRTE